MAVTVSLMNMKGSPAQFLRSTDNQADSKLVPTIQPANPANFSRCTFSDGPRGSSVTNRNILGVL